MNTGYTEQLIIERAWGELSFESWADECQNGRKVAGKSLGEMIRESMNGSGRAI